jgi:hypothetical protein
VDTVTKPEFGSLEYCAGIIRRYATNTDVINPLALGIIEGLLESAEYTDAARLGFIRNALAAANLVRDELR